MKNRFYSKVDWWLWVVLGFGIGSLVIEIINDILNNPSIATLVMSVVAIFLSWIIFGTYYELKDDYLLIKCGPFKNKLYYDNITKIRLKKSFISSSALSTDRIEIIYNRSLHGYISPKNKDEFVKMLEHKCGGKKLT